CDPHGRTAIASWTGRTRHGRADSFDHPGHIPTRGEWLGTAPSWYPRMTLQSTGLTPTALGLTRILSGPRVRSGRSASLRPSLFPYLLAAIACTGDPPPIRYSGSFEEVPQVVGRAGMA